MDSTARVAVSGLILALAVVLAGCGVGGGSVTGAASGTLRVALASQPDCLDPHISSKSEVAELARSVLDSLVAQDAKGGIHPWLAQSWTISPDGLTYQFRLRTDVTFSDGTPFTAEAVKANLDHIVAPSTKSLAAAASVAGVYAKTTVVDPHTVDIRLTKPDASLLTVLSSAEFGMELPSTLTSDPPSTCARIVGTGPFVQEQPWSDGLSISYGRNPGYAWAAPTATHTGPARLNTIRVSFMPQDQVRLGALTSGQVDLIDSVPVASVGALRANSGFVVAVTGIPGANYAYYPNSSSKPFADVRVRQAFRDGIDWGTIVNKLTFGVYQQAKGPVSATTPMYDKAVESMWRCDPTLAASLLDQAGYTSSDADGYRVKDGQRLVVHWRVPQGTASDLNQTIAEQVQAAAKQLGIQLDITDVPLGQALSDLRSGNYDLRDGSFVADDPDVLRRMFDTASIPTPNAIGGNLARYSNSTVDADLAAALATTDRVQRARLYGQVQVQLMQDAVVFPVYTVASVLAYSRAVSGVDIEPEGFPGFYDTVNS